MSIIELAIANTAEAFLDLIHRYDDSKRDQLVYDEHVLGDRAILWGAGDKKIVLTSYPIPHLEYAVKSLGYIELRNFSPQFPTESLCTDILLDKQLFNTIVSHLSKYAEIRLMSYVASTQLAILIDALSSAGLNLVLGETPVSADGLEISRRFSTKAGFRSMFEQWDSSKHGLAMPTGIICHTADEAVQETIRRLGEGRSCLCKADKGESGIGLLWFKSSENLTADLVKERIIGEAAFGDDPIIVEDLIYPPEDLSSTAHSPSIEAYISQAGDVDITYSCGQLFEASGHFTGVYIGSDLLSEDISRQMKVAIEYLGQKLATQGYRGYFDLDFVIDNKYQVFVVEGNPRRTGGTHLHDLATFLFGTRYFDRFVLLTRSSKISSTLTKWEEVVAVTGDLLFCCGQRESGIIPIVTSTISSGIIGYAVVAKTAAAALELELSFLNIIAPAEIVSTNEILETAKTG